MKCRSTTTTMKYGWSGSTRRVYTARIALAVAVLACARPQDAPAQDGRDTRPGASSREPIVAAAMEALDDGRPWHATEILDSAFRAGASRTPEAVLTAATAAAAWEGWDRVARELGTASWIDTMFDGQARELLARAALASNADSLAAVHARRALALSRSTRARGVRAVLLARALDRQALGDSAAAWYTRAATDLPEIADWLELRAAGSTADASRRQRIYARVTSDVARARIAPTEAQARERWRDFAGAAQAYAALHQRGESLRLRLLAGPDSATRRAIRNEAIAIVTRVSSTADVRDVIPLLDDQLGPLTTHEELLVARAASDAGLLGRAAQGFARAASLDARDRYRYATVLSRLGRDAAAATQFARVPPRSSLGPSAAYQHARSLLRAGKRPAAVTALRTVVRDFRRDESAASLALFLLADLATDEGRDEAARDAFLTVATRYPSSRSAPEARFRAALIAFASGAHATAARELDALARQYPKSTETTAARYWAGRAHLAAGQRTIAHERWNQVLRADPLSYYAVRSAARLGVTGWRPDSTAATVGALPTLELAAQRGALLDEVGMGTEESYEYGRIASGAGRSPDSLIAAATILRDRGQVPRSITLARRALAARAPRDARLFRLLYPLAYSDVIRTEARSRDIDPALAAALIHQESAFYPHATSRAGARGLMQVMPTVGAALARSQRMTGFERVLLYQPDVNVRLGMTHLETMLREYPRVEYALAAYNAGGSPVRRWRDKRGTDDPELFVERIPYTETRDYVRILLRNRAMYATLYRW